MTSLLHLGCVINNGAAGLFSLIMNSLLFFMVWFRSISDLKNYRIFFLINIVIDFVFTIAFLSTHLIFINENSNVVFIASGPITQLGPTTSYVCLIIQIFFYPFVIMIIPCTYIYRYLLICRDIKLGKPKIFLMFFVIFILMQPFMISTIHFHFTTPEYKEIYENMIRTVMEFESPENSYYIGGRMASADFFTALISASITFSGSYIIIIFCSMKIVTTLNSQRHVLSPTSRMLQKQLTQVLLIESVLPLFVFVIPMMFIIADTAFGMNFGKLNTVLLSILEWVPACDSAITLFCVRPYRRGVKKLFAMGKSSTTVESMTQR
ncbi:hypothetical protein QR680_016189 [Steinernema hermaphroditum]|uniref:G-protein coupled receptors family 1 profile domain-containing protein n=1 Tax=Steinernema hermaphroditum TaxID=289476 RepID=A0AA39HCA8_9BILA|nr:hypothetical protein QR680_016189 [Steinernema hermaphroditum]